tara:strand:+ start:64568 stop:65380 length:813 start_codon:yes stop_codon:yes gene_type:complete
MSKELQKFTTLVITGGSSGIGDNFISTFITINKNALVCNLSRTKPSEKFPSDRVCHFPCDLSDSQQLKDSSGAIIELLAQQPSGGPVLLVNNSGFGSYGFFKDLPRENELSMLDLNIRAMVDLTSRLLPLLLERGGTIVNIASTAAFQPTPTMATYGATKSFVLDWSLSLADELRGSNVRCLVVCPGPTGTAFFKRAGFEGPPLPSGVGHTASFVTQEIVTALEAKKHLVVCGYGNALLACLSSKLPKRWVAYLSGWILRKVRLKLLKRS